MSLRLVAMVGGALLLLILIPALVVGGSVTMAFALPVAILAVVAILVLKVVYDVKIARDFGANSGISARELVDPNVRKQDKPAQQQSQQKGGPKR